MLTAAVACAESLSCNVLNKLSPQTARRDGLIVMGSFIKFQVFINFQGAILKFYEIWLTIKTAYKFRAQDLVQ